MNNKYVKLLLQNLSHVTLGVLVVLLGVVYYLKSNENFVPPKSTPPSEVKPDPILPVRELDLALERLNPPPPLEKTRVGVVKQFDMFDVQVVEDTKAREQKANQMYAEAQALAAQGKIKEALDRTEDIFKVYPPHIQAKELRAELQKKLNATPAPAGASPSPAAAENAAAAGAAATTPAPAAATPAASPAATPAA